MAKKELKSISIKDKGVSNFWDTLYMYISKFVFLFLINKHRMSIRTHHRVYMQAEIAPLCKLIDKGVIEWYFNEDTVIEVSNFLDQLSEIQVDS